MNAKVFIFTVFIFTSISCFSQLTGKYCNSQQLGTTCISFNLDSSFYYERYNCTSNTKAKGNYTIKGKLLVLNFIKDSTTAQQNIITLNPKETQADSIQIKVNVSDLNEKYRIAFTPIYISLENNIIGLVMTDLEGNGCIKISKSKLSATLNISVLSYYKVTINDMVLDKDYDAVIQLVRENQDINIDKIEYQIKPVSDNLILMKGNQGFKKFIKS